MPNNSQENKKRIRTIEHHVQSRNGLRERLHLRLYPFLATEKDVKIADEKSKLEGLSSYSLDDKTRQKVLNNILNSPGYKLSLLMMVAVKFFINAEKEELAKHESIIITDLLICKRDLTPADYEFIRNKLLPFFQKDVSDLHSNYREGELDLIVSKIISGLYSAMLAEQMRGSTDEFLWLKTMLGAYDIDSEFVKLDLRRRFAFDDGLRAAGFIFLKVFGHPYERIDQIRPFVHLTTAIIDIIFYNIKMLSHNEDIGSKNKYLKQYQDFKQSHRKYNLILPNLLMLTVLMACFMACYVFDLNLFNPYVATFSLISILLFYILKNGTINYLHNLSLTVDFLATYEQKEFMENLYNTLKSLAIERNRVGSQKIEESGKNVLRLAPNYVEVLPIFNFKLFRKSVPKRLRPPKARKRNRPDFDVDVDSLIDMHVLQDIQFNLNGKIIKAEDPMVVELTNINPEINGRKFILNSSLLSTLGKVVSELNYCPSKGGEGFKALSGRKLTCEINGGIQIVSLIIKTLGDEARRVPLAVVKGTDGRGELYVPLALWNKDTSKRHLTKVSCLKYSPTP